MKNKLLIIGEKSKKSFSNQLSSKKKDQVLYDYYRLIEKNKNLIIKQNKKDIDNAKKNKLKENLIKRLILNDKKNNQT